MRTFTTSDQELFAALSSDCNPMHMDPVAARRLLSGRPVVHGVHTLLSAFEALPADLVLDIGTVECEFVHPVNVGDTVRFEVDLSGDMAVIQVLSGDRLCTDVRLLRRLVGQAVVGSHLADEASDSPTRFEAGTWSGGPLSEPAQSWSGRRGAIVPSAARLDAHFPGACRLLGHDFVRSLAATSFLVGMVCPGEHSIYSSLRLGCVDAKAFDEMHFKVRRFDPRFKLMTLEIDGSIRGEVRAFVRPAAQSQPSMQEACGRLDGNEFSGTRALIVGGSRGLGELAAKLVTAGGGDAVVTYASGRIDAERVVAEILAAGRGRCRAQAFRLGDSSWDSLLTQVGPVDSVYFFVTPRIFRKGSGLFDRRLFDEFVDCYAAEFASLCAQLESRETPSVIRVFFPSTTAVTDRPRGMTEYAMAKLAAEALIDDLGRVLRRVRIVPVRLPRLNTDQTSTVIPVRSESNLDVMLPIVRIISAPG